jgi:hypothetical protein
MCSLQRSEYSNLKLAEASTDEPMWVTIYKCMEALLGITMYSYLYLKLAKMLSFLLSLMFSLQQNQRTRWQNRFCPEAGKWERR